MAAALAVGLAGCAGGSAGDDDENALLALAAQDIPCPPARLLADTARLIAPAWPGSEDRPAHPAYEADLLSAVSVCQRTGDAWSIGVRIQATAGAVGAASDATVRLPVFAAVTEFSRTVLDKKIAEVPVRFDPRVSRQSVEITIQGLSVAASALHPGPGYEVLVGFQLTPEQVERNRRGRRGP